MNFGETLASLLDQVPPGRVTTFGALAQALGDDRAAVAVHRWIDRERPPGWHRALRADGALPFPEAAPLLRREGVAVRDGRAASFRDRRFEAFASDRPLEALRAEQEALARRVVLEDEPESPRTVAGFDVSYRGREAFGAAVVLDPDSLEVDEEVALRTEVDFPYIPTYLAFREFGPIAELHEALETEPGLLLVDGNGILHPADFGLACLVGVKLDRPTVGVAKSLLLGEVKGEPGPGEAVPVRLGGRAVGSAYRSPRGGRPIYVSPGHRVSVARALHRVRPLCRRRIPEPLRRADRAARRLRRRRS